MWASNAGVFNFYLRITTTNKVKELKKLFQVLRNVT